MNEQPKVVILSINWETHDVFPNFLEGEDCGRVARAAMKRDSFLWRDFPTNEGWAHSVMCNRTGGALYAKAMMQTMGVDDKVIDEVFEEEEGC